MSVIRGKNVVLYITSWYDSGAFRLPSDRVIACARSSTLTTTTSLIETTTAGSGKGTTYQAQKNNTTGSIEGVVFVNESLKLTVPILRQKQLSHALLHGKLIRTADDGTIYKDTFEFWITSIADTGATGDFDTFQMDFQVNGDPIIEVIVQEAEVAPERFVEWRWSSLEPVIVPVMDVVTNPFTHIQPHTLNQQIEISVAGMPADKWLLVRFPNDETNPTAWYNTPANNGSLPDSVFYGIITSGDFKYIKTRVPATFDTTQTLKFTH